MELVAFEPVGVWAVSRLAGEWVVSDPVVELVTFEPVGEQV